MIRRVFVLVLLVLATIWWWKRQISGSGRRPQGETERGPARALGPMVRDRVCNTFLPKSRALTLRAGGEEHHFCSEACRAKFLAQTGIRSA